MMMNLNSQINSVLREFENGDKLSSYKKLIKIFKNNTNNNLLRYNLAVIQQQLNFNEDAKKNYKYLIKVEKNIKAMINLYNIYIIESKYYEALKTIDRILNMETIDNVEKDKAFGNGLSNKLFSVRTFTIFSFLSFSLSFIIEARVPKSA